MHNIRALILEPELSPWLWARRKALYNLRAMSTGHKQGEGSIYVLSPTLKGYLRFQEGLPHFQKYFPHFIPHFTHSSPFFFCPTGLVGPLGRFSTVIPFEFWPEQHLFLISSLWFRCPGDLLETLTSPAAPKAHVTHRNGERGKKKGTKNPRQDHAQCIILARTCQSQAVTAKQTVRA